MKANILLDNGTIIEAQTSFLFPPTFGELVFNTGMTGYQEIITDPSYAGQAVVMTYPLIGNYGINIGEDESKAIQVKALVVKEASDELIDHFYTNQIPLLFGVDTRMITKQIRQQGTMNCLITSRQVTKEDEVALKAFKFPRDMVAKVSSISIQHVEGKGPKIGLVDYGYKISIMDILTDLGCDITIFPFDVSKEKILEYELDALLLSNGPGDPKDMKVAIEACRGLLGEMPLWGICLGHQIIALALSGDTYKLKFGHRGSNHPVINTQTGKVIMTSQNHGYAVHAASLPEDVRVSYKNINDDTIEGIEVNKYGIQTVQFHPEDGPGPEDGRMIIKKWVHHLKEDDTNASQ